jgi:hypothetical protein
VAVPQGGCAGPPGQQLSRVVAELVSAVDPAWVAAVEQASGWELRNTPNTAEITTQLQQR